MIFPMALSCGPLAARDAATIICPICGLSWVGSFQVGKDVLVTMCPLMRGRTRLLPDEELDQRHAMCDLAPLSRSVFGAWCEDCATCRHASRFKATRDVSLQLKP